MINKVKVQDKIKQDFNICTNILHVNPDPGV